MSGLLALLDDVAGIAKVAAASLDDISAAATKAGAKAAGVVIDDAAVTPKYVQGFDAKRELPIIWRIARGSLINKLIYLLPAAILMSVFAPWLMPPLLILGGSYLCFEGAEKVLHVLRPTHSHSDETDDMDGIGNPAQLEEKKIAGAIKTDFILSAEIMTIALSTIESPSIWIQIGTLAVVGVFITAVVYGAVAIIVKMDDVGLWLSRVGLLPTTRALGRAIVKLMPWLLKALTVIGTAAMLWVGGSIIVHSLAQMGWSAPEEAIHHVAVAFGNQNAGLEWIITAALDFVLGLAIGLCLIPIGTKIVTPIWKSITDRKKSAA